MTTATNFATLTGQYELDPSHTRIGFVARHAMVTKVRGGFNDSTDTIHIDGEEPSKSTATVTIKSHSIDTRNADRDAHLRSNDFLQMDEYPELTFVSTAVRYTSEATFEVTGDL